MHKLRHERRGVAVIEFALLSPIMLFLICGAIEIGNMIFARVVLEGAVTEAARLATASLEDSEAQRTTTMKNSIIESMHQFPIAKNNSLVITTTVYRNFSDAYPEPYNDANGNKKYDLGETFSDRNQNGIWDDAKPVTGSTLGGPGDVVSYTAKFPKRVLFSFVGDLIGFKNGVIPLAATTVTRNEAVVRKTSS